MVHTTNADMHPNIRVLILEDSEADALLAIQEMKEAGIAFEWRRVETRETFLDALDSFDPTVILADFTLPQFDGRTALQLTRSSRGDDIPFFFVTGTLGEHLAIDLLREGATDYVLKTALGRLGPAVQRALREQTATRERKAAEKAHLEALERYRQVVENATDIVYSLNREGYFIYTNQAGLRLSGYSMGELWGLQYLDLVVPDHRRRVQRHYIRQLLSRTSTSTLEFPFRTKNGDIRWLEANGALIFEDSEFRGVHVIARDITEQKAFQAEILNTTEQLHALAARLQSVREDEQTRIARAVHDDLGQALTALKMDLVWMEKKMAEFSPAAGGILGEKVTSMQSLIDETIRTVRRISSELRPGVLDDLGLVAAIEWQLSEFAQRTGTKASFQNNGRSEDLDSDRANALFRILQEALTNIVRHSSATHVRVTLTTGDGVIEMEVRDNGRGIMPEEIGRSGSLGLLGMKERAWTFGGSVEIHGRAGKGTSVIACIPVRKRGDHA